MYGKDIKRIFVVGVRWCGGTNNRERCMGREYIIVTWEYMIAVLGFRGRTLNTLQVDILQLCLMLHVYH